MNANLKMAIEFATDKKKLKKRLLEAKSVLTAEYKPKFTNAEFNFEDKKLIGDGYTLQWQIRLQPNKPESFINQQTSIGTVIILKQ